MTEGEKDVCYYCDERRDNLFHDKIVEFEDLNDNKHFIHDRCIVNAVKYAEKWWKLMELIKP